MRPIMPCAALIAVMLGFGQAASAGALFPKVLVTVAPLAPYMNEILAGAGQAESLIRPGQDPHTMTISPSQAHLLDEAEILVIPDAAMSPVLMRQLAARKKLKVIELSKFPEAEVLPYQDENPWIATIKEAAAEKDEHAHDDSVVPLPLRERLGEGAGSVVQRSKTARPLTPPSPARGEGSIAKINDPHFWLDPERMAALARPLADAIADISPDNRATLRANAQRLSIHLRQEVSPAMKGLLVAKMDTPNLFNKPEIPFITYHAAYQYFLARFGLNYTGEITARPDDYLGAKTLDSLLNRAKEVRIHCVISEMDTTLVRRIAKMSEAKIVILSPEQNIDENDVPPVDWVRNGYDRLLYKTAKSFGDCL